MRIIGNTNSIRAALEARTVIKVFMTENFKNDSVLKLIKELHVNYEIVSKDKLDTIFKGSQGAVAQVKDIHTVGLDEIFAIAKKKKNPIVVMLDELNDPHNLGAILRSSDAFDVSGIVYKKRGQVSLNDTVIKVSTGAANFVKCAEVTNLTQAIKKFKENGFWVIGLDGDSNQTLKDTPKDVPLLIVTGSEGFGISRLVKENCDLILKIPMFGKVNCLNASVACGIALYAIRNGQ